MSTGRSKEWPERICRQAIQDWSSTGQEQEEETGKPGLRCLAVLGDQPVEDRSSTGSDEKQDQEQDPGRRSCCGSGVLRVQPVEERSWTGQEQEPELQKGLRERDLQWTAVGDRLSTGREQELERGGAPGERELRSTAVQHDQPVDDRSSTGQDKEQKTEQLGWVQTSVEELVLNQSQTPLSSMLLLVYVCHEDSYIPISLK